MKAKCPGQDSRHPIDSTIVPCPACGNDVELFSDEPRRRCHCGQVVTRPTLPKCVEWCPAAAQCFGKAVDIRLLKKRVEEVKHDPRAVDCLKTIRGLLRKRKSGVGDE